MSSNFFENVHHFGNGKRIEFSAGCAPIRGQQIVWKIKAEFGLLKSEKENVQKFLMFCFVAMF